MINKHNDSRPLNRRVADAFLVGSGGAAGKYVGGHVAAALWHHTYDALSIALQVFEALARATGHLG
ncbi:hypothetical protein [Streptomyces carpinensis]|uniref:Uncharacterized protein n=1 Tax=Streptomyces carpinensis TaxID=66369 RepID=A0ABV1WD96_9ACTN|nr:hypothetical protein [Streptomyces carpinensis]